MPKTDKQYLGDGVYAAFDGFQIVLTTEDGIRTTNRIYLNDDTLAALGRYVERLNAKYNESEPDDDSSI